MNGLNKVSGCENADRIGDVIFVHGLDGDASTTWHPDGRPADFWPGWLAEDLPNLGVWALGYEVHASAWKGTTMPLVDRATNTLALLDAQDIGQRPLVFIAHSLGGLLVKQILRHACDFGDPKWKAMIGETKGVVFFSTPHSGSNIASWIEYLGKLLRTTVTLDELKAHDSRLRELNLWYRNNVQHLQIKTQVYFEKQKVAGILVVDETSADPGIPGVIPVPMDDNHVTICKPESKQSLAYTRVKKFIEERFSLGPQ